MPITGTTALLALVPVAEDLLRAVDPELVRADVPAHAALLYPWLPVEQVTDEVAARLRELLAGTAALTLRLESIEVSHGFVGITVPELAALAATVRAAWPESVPYGGRFGAAPPVHVTIVMGATDDQADQVADLVSTRLPLVQPVTELHVVGLTEQGWQRLLTLPLG